MTLSYVHLSLVSRCPLLLLLTLPQHGRSSLTNLAANEQEAFSDSEVSYHDAIIPSASSVSLNAAFGTFGLRTAQSEIDLAGQQQQQQEQQETPASFFIPSIHIDNATSHSAGEPQMTLNPFANSPTGPLGSIGTMSSNASSVSKGSSLSVSGTDDPGTPRNVYKGNIAALFFPSGPVPLMHPAAFSFFQSRSSGDIPNAVLGRGARTQQQPAKRGRADTRHAADRRGSGSNFTRPREPPEICISYPGSLTNSPAVSPPPHYPDDVNSDMVRALLALKAGQYGNAMDVNTFGNMSMQGEMRRPQRRTSAYTSQSIFSVDELAKGDDVGLNRAIGGQSQFGRTRNPTSAILESELNVRGAFARAGRAYDAPGLSPLGGKKQQFQFLDSYGKVLDDSASRPTRTGTRSSSRYQGSDVVSDIDALNVDTPTDGGDTTDRDANWESDCPSGAPSPKQSRPRQPPIRTRIALVWEKKYRRIYVSPIQQRISLTADERKKCRTCLQMPSGDNPVLECKTCRVLFHPDCEEPPLTWAHEASHVFCSDECFRKTQDRVGWLQPPSFLMACGFIRNLDNCLTDTGLKSLTRTRRGSLKKTIETRVNIEPSIGVTDCVVVEHPPDTPRSRVVVRHVFFDTYGAEWIFASNIVEAPMQDGGMLTCAEIGDHHPRPYPVTSVVEKLGFQIPIPSDISRLHCQQTDELTKHHPRPLPECPVVTFTQALADPTAFDNAK